MEHADRFDEKYDLVRFLRKGKFTYQRSYQPFNFDGLNNQYRYLQPAFREWRELARAGKLPPEQKAFYRPRPAEMLFDLESDPHEVNNLADDPAHADTLADFGAQADARWDLDAYDADVRISQARRWVVYEALREGGYYPWDYQPLQKASERYMRNHMDLNVVEHDQRFPRDE
jgi:hypothetical protein